MVTAGQEGRRRFPALDPEPPPRTWWRVAVPAGVALAVAVAGIAVAAWPSSSGGRRPHRAAALPVVAAGGHVAVQTLDGGLALADPNGGHVMKLTIPGFVPGGYAPPLPSPDGRYLVTMNFQVVAVGEAKPALVPGAQIPVSAQVSVPPPSPFADRDQALVLVESPLGMPTTSAPVSVYLVKSGRSYALGTGARAAGDPQTVGAFVSVAAPVRPSAAPAPATEVAADARIELREAGRRPVVLATAAALNRDAGLDASLPVTLTPYPDPSGRAVAVQVCPTASSLTCGIDVLDRGGRALGSVPAALGPPTGQPLAWSRTARSIAFPTSGTSGEELSVWTIGGAARTQAFPDIGYQYVSCVWSPDGSAILCAGYRGPGTRHGRWAIAATGSGGIVSVPAPGGVPLIWLPAKPGPGRG